MSGRRTTRTCRGNFAGALAALPRRPHTKERAAEEKVARLFVSEERRLTDALDVAGRKLGALVEKDAERARWIEKHPEVPGRLREIGAEISGIDEEMDRLLGGRWSKSCIQRPNAHAPRAFPVPRLQPGYRAAGPRFRNRSLTPNRSAALHASDVPVLRGSFRQVT